MGVVNATPDSFSDQPGEKQLGHLIGRARELVEQGADWIDIGGESGVTGLPPVEAADEIDRVCPLIEAVAAQGAVVSVDTYKPAVARAAVAAGASLINDVSGLADPDLAAIAAETGCGLVIMHTRAEPKQKAFPDYGDVVADIEWFFDERIETALGAGVAEQQIVLDPGPDFAKRPAETVAALRSLPRLAGFGRPLLAAISRKDFIGALTGRPPHERLAGTLAAAGFAVRAGASILRVHDIADVADFLRVQAVLDGHDDIDPELMLAQHLRRRPA